jgi:hypothetical protein
MKEEDLTVINGELENAQNLKPINSNTAIE